MANEFVVDPHFGWVGAQGNLVFLRKSNHDVGGSWAYTEVRPHDSADSLFHYTTMSMGDGSRVTLGGSPMTTAYVDYQLVIRDNQGQIIYTAPPRFPDYLFADPSNKAYNLIYYGEDMLYSVATVTFSGDGELDFASATGAGIPGSTDDGPKTPIIITGNRSLSFWKPVNDVSAYGFQSAGTLRVLGDMTAEVNSFSGETDFVPYASKDVLVDTISGDTLNAAAYRTTAFIVNGNFRGELKSQSSNITMTHYNKAAYNNNTIGAYGVYSDGEITVGGWFDGGIEANIENIMLSDENIVGLGTSRTDASVADNEINAIGLQGTNITLEDFYTPGSSHTDLTNSIYTNVSNVELTAYSTGGDTSSTSTAGNNIRSVAILATNITINGLFEGSLKSEINELYVRQWGSVTYSWGSYYYLSGLYASGNLTANRNLGGTIDLDFNTSDISYAGGLYSYTYGIYAQNLNVTDGYIRTDIDIVHNYGTSNSYSSSEYIAGIRASSLTAVAYDGTINITVTGKDLVSAGLMAYEFHGSTDSTVDSTLDIIGSITVNNTAYSGFSIGILGGTTEELNLRISGDIVTNNGYAVFAGWMTSLNAVTRYINNNDRIEVASGAYVEGDIDLMNGQNYLTVDSNARIWGDVLSDLGTLNLEYIINSDPFNEFTDSATANQAAIIRARSDVALASTANVTLNLNSAEVGSYVLYQWTVNDQSSEAAWETRAVDFKYQGITTEVLENLGIVITPEMEEQYNIKVTSKGLTGRLVPGGDVFELKDSNNNTIIKIGIDVDSANRQVVLVISDMPAEGVANVPLKQLESLTMQYNRELRTATLAWDDPDTNVGEVYEVEYCIVTNGVRSKSIVQMVNSSAKDSLVIKNIESNQTVEWRVRQNLGNGDSVSDWTNWTGTSEGDIPYDYVCTPVTDAKYVADDSGASAVSHLAWQPGEYSEGVTYYEVEYFQSSVNITGEIDWDNTATMQKMLTSTDLFVSGLNNTEYFYWRVRAYDGSGKYSEWTTGEMFRSYNDDITPPVFGQKPDPSVVYVVPSPQPDPFTVTANTLDLILNWKAATDDRSGVSRYTVSWKLSSDTDWNTVDISVTDENKTDYEFRLSDYADLVANGTYQWRITASDYVGRTSTAQTGTWTTDTTGPTFDTGSVEYVSVWEDGSKPLSITVAWDAAEDEEGGSGLYYYQLRYKSSTSGSWSVVNLPTSDLNVSLSLTNAAYYDYELSAFDKAGNESSIASGIWYGDSVAPTLDDTSAIAVSNSYDPTTKKSVLVFDWSTATDTSLGPVSGFAYYELAYYDEDDVRHVLGTYDEDTLSASITVGKGGQISGLADGYYSWSITAYDNAGNGNEYFGSDFLIDTQAPTGSFNSPSLTGHATTESTSTTQDTVLPAFGGTPVVVGDPTYTWVITDIWVTFTFNGDFTDNSGEVYYILQVSDSATFTGNNTHEFTTDQDSVTLDSTNGYGAGALIGDGRLIYWRIQAMDSSGNRTGAWTLGTPFYFVSETTGEYTPLEDTTIPTSVSSATVTVVDKNTTNTVTLAWDASYDLFGVETYEITYSAKGVAKKTITVSATDTSTILKFQNGTADGLYSWSVRAVDYVGNKSEWFSGSQFLVDTINPVLNASSFKIISVQGAQDIGFTWAAATDANLYYYEIEVTAPNGEVSYVDTDETSFWIYNQPNGLYSFRVRAIDLLGNTSDWSDSRKFMVDTTADPGNTFATAAALGFTGSRETMVGGSDPGDMFKLTLTTAASVTITLTNVETLEGKNTGVKVNVYDSNGKKLKSISVKSGTKSLDNLLFDVVGSSTDYYVQVVSASGTANVAKYTISATKQDFEESSNNTDWANATELPLTDGSGSFADGWVGFGDAADYYKFTAEHAGSLTLDFSGIDSATSLKVSLYALVDGKYKRMASTTVKSDMDNIFKKSVLAQSGEYYLVVESGDKGKGKYNSGYDFSVDDSYYQAATPNSDWANAEPIALTDGTGSFDDGWVGFGDPADYYSFETDAAGSINVDMSGLDPNASLKVSLYALVDGKYKRMASVTVKSDMDDIFKKDVLAQSGTYYLVVESADKGKGKYNSYYDVTVNDEYFPVETVGNNDFANAEEKTLTSGGMNTDVSGWVGFGDATDCYLLKATGAGSIDFSFNNLEAGMKIKVSLYDLNGKKIKSYTVTDTKPLLVENMLLKDDCYLVVESADKGKGKYNTGYVGSVTYNEFPTEATSNNTLATATSVNFTGAVVEQNDEWVGYGDNVDFFSFELDANGRIDLDLALDNADLRVGKQIKVKLYSEDGKLLKLDSNLMSNELEAGKYSVSVETTSQEKYWTGYDLSVTKLA